MSKSNRGRDIPGNSVASAQAFNKELMRTGEALLRFETLADNLANNMFVVTELRVQCPCEKRSDYLVVVKGFGEEGHLVGFCSGDTLHEALRNVVGRLQSGTLKFRKDEYAK